MKKRRFFVLMLVIFAITLLTGCATMTEIAVQKYLDKKVAEAEEANTAKVNKSSLNDVIRIFGQYTDEINFEEEGYLIKVTEYTIKGQLKLLTFTSNNDMKDDKASWILRGISTPNNPSQYYYLKQNNREQFIIRVRNLISDFLGTARIATSSPQYQSLTGK